MSTAAIIAITAVAAVVWLVVGAAVGIVIGKVLKRRSQDYPRPRKPPHVNPPKPRRDRGDDPQQWPPTGGHG